MSRPAPSADRVDGEAAVRRGSIRVTPARRWRLADMLYGQLVKQIVEHDMPEGGRLPSEAEIARMFGASRPVVRQALKRLQADGLVYSRKGSGSFVQTRPPTRITELTDPSRIASYLRCNEARVAIETEAARLAALRRTRDDLRAIDEAVIALAGALDQGQTGIEQDLAFHRIIAKATDNELFPRLLAELQELMRGSMALGLGLTRTGSELRRQQVVKEHRQIAEAIAAQDGEAAALYMRFHLAQSRLRTIDARIEA
jgi:GntR family transcriptional repressor for pyruvate dehydrogenase complex